MDTFGMKTKLYMGEDALMGLKELTMLRVYLICDPFMKQSGMVERVTAILDGKGVLYQLFSEIIPDPTIAVVTKAVERMRVFAPDTIIALGGGSAIDTAKAVGYIYSQMQNNQHQQPPVSLIAIPTTSGTGSEVTSFAVISDPDAGVKYPLVSNQMLPDAAFLDPGFTMSVPPHITADTGIDVLTHALEAYVSIKAQDFTDACAEKAIRLVWQYLETTVKNGSDMKAGSQSMGQAVANTQ